MIDARDIRDALEDRNKHLLREIAENKVVMENADKWISEVERVIAIARECYVFVSEPEVAIEWDPECGVPHIEIAVYTNEYSYENYEKWVDKVCSDPAHKALLDLGINMDVWVK